MPPTTLPATFTTATIMTPVVTAIIVAAAPVIPEVVIAPEERPEEGKLELFEAIVVIIIVRPVTPSAAVRPMTMAIWPQVSGQHRPSARRQAATERHGVCRRQGRHAENDSRHDQRTHTRHLHGATP
jgi:hypothetical protein